MKKILAIGIDGAEATLINKWTQDGSLPTLKRLIEEGGYGPIDSFAKYLPGSNWFTFYLGQQPGQHGLYSYLNWDHQEMKAKIPSQKWVKVNVTSFWHHIRSNKAKGVILNVPEAFMLRKFNGIEVMALSNDHAITPMISHPPHVVGDIKNHFGNLSFPEENYDLLSLKEFLSVRDEMIGLMLKLRDVYLKLMVEENWDFFLAVFPMLHRAGHRLWSTINIYDIKTEQEKAEAADALRQVYMVFDKVLAELLSTKKQTDITFVFSFYGMQDNCSREKILPEMLRRVLDSKEVKTNQTQTKLKRFLVWMRDLIPNSWRHRVKSKLPYIWRYKLVSFWRLGQLNWKKVKAFVIPLEVNIGIRINLKGREKLGIVESGTEYENLCRQIMNGLQTFVDADSKKPLVKEFHFSRNLFKGSKVERLPDIIGLWNDEPSSQHRMITSPVYGDIPWPTPGKNPEGRSGNHNDKGFLITYGTQVRRGKLYDVHILDFAPTVLALLDEPIPPGLEGKTLPLFMD
jgi:predicted AlkP superfamily phosphohydrolase/phosphomutase